ncbi:MAG: pilus assembly protein TadG-related protein [Alphaproteobacteria bacterium]
MRKPAIISTQTPKLRRLTSDRTGSVAALWGLALPVMVGFLGLGTEVGGWYITQSQLQQAADAGAVAGALELALGETASLQTEAMIAAASNGFADTDGSHEVNHPPARSPTFSGNRDTVEVYLDTRRSPSFSALFISQDITIAARAVAKVVEAGDACVLALESTAADATGISGTPNVNLNGCMLAVNSSSPEALTITGNAKLTAEAVSVVGDVVGRDHIVTTNGILKGRRVADPYADKAPPPVPAGGCDSTHTNVRVGPSETVTLTPGRYCGEMSLKGNVTLAPGVYIIDDGGLTIDGGAIVTGEGVTIYLTGSTPATVSTVTVNGGATVTLSAPTSGSYSGMLFWQAPGATSSGVNRFNGGATMQLKGALYFPTQEIQFTGGATTGPQCTKVVSRVVTFKGNANMKADGCKDAGVDDIKIAGQVTLVE